MKKIKLNVEGIRCEGCVKKIEDKLKSAQIPELNINIQNKTVEVSCDESISPMFLKKELEALGHAVTKFEVIKA